MVRTRKNYIPKDGENGAIEVYLDFRTGEIALCMRNLKTGAEIEPIRLVPSHGGQTEGLLDVVTVLHSAIELQSFGCRPKSDGRHGINVR